MITIYHIEERRSERVVWLMEELGLPYRLEFKPGDLLGSQAILRQNHPVGSAPAIRDGEIVMTESAAILEYIIHRYGGGRFAVAPASADYPAYLQWLHLAEGTVAFRLIVEYTILAIPGGAALSPQAASMLGRTRRILDFAESELAGRPWFGGQDFSAADIMMHFNIKLAQLWNFDLSNHVALLGWYDRVQQRPAYQRMVAAARPNGATPPVFKWATVADDWR